MEQGNELKEAGNGKQERRGPSPLTLQGLIPFSFEWAKPLGEESTKEGPSPLILKGFNFSPRKRSGQKMKGVG